LSSLVLPGRVLRLVDDAAMLRAQLAHEPISVPNARLVERLSTDEILPAWACFRHDPGIAKDALTGFRIPVFESGTLASAGFSVLVSGAFQGAGSSREVAPQALYHAGIRLCLAPSFEKIYRRNCHNIGLFTSTDLSLMDLAEIPFEQVTRGLDSLTCSILAHGGLLAHAKAMRLARPHEVSAPTSSRPLTMVERILANHVAQGVEPPVSMVPGETLWVDTDLRFSHDYVTEMVADLYQRSFGPSAPLARPSQVLLFRDHLPLLAEVVGEDESGAERLARSRAMAEAQRAFAERHRLRLFGEAGEPRGICHQLLRELLVLPGQVVVGTDSHTTTAGALGALAFGVGATELAASLSTGRVSVRLPPTLRVELRGRLRPRVTAKDLMLWLLARADFRAGLPLEAMLEFGGEGLCELGMDERATLCNMAVEAGAFGAICEVDAVTERYLTDHRAPFSTTFRVVRPEPGASYLAVLDVALDELEPMIARPSDPHHAVPLRVLVEEATVPIDIAYLGSCTGGKDHDIALAAEVVREHLLAGHSVPAQVAFFVQFASDAVRRRAEARGDVAWFERAGARLVAPGCGACIRAGPGVSVEPSQCTVSACNRNFPGRSGPGRVFLASPAVVVASAFAGALASPWLRGAEG